MMVKTLKDNEIIQKNVMKDILKFINRYDKLSMTEAEAMCIHG